MSKVKNKDTSRSDVFIGNFEHIYHLVLMLILSS